VRHHGRTPRLGFDQLAFDADLVEQFGDAFRGIPLTRAGVETEVRCVDPDQLLAELHNLGFWLVVRAHRFIFADAPDL
jgi:hypothetical protein